MIRTYFAGAALAFVAACAPPAPTSQPGSPSAPSAASCAREGGELKRVGRMQSLQCVVRFADAGKPCVSGTQCLGECRLPEPSAAPSRAATVGVCQATSDRFGCYTRVEQGRPEATICVD